MQDYMDSMHHYLGASCEVLKLNNRLLFAGSIHHYDDGEEELTVSIRNGSETPQGIIHRARHEQRAFALWCCFPLRS